MPVEKKGTGCKSLGLLRTPAVEGEGLNKNQHRVCAKRGGFMLNHWRCVGKDHPDCPGYEDNFTTNHATTGETE